MLRICSALVLCAATALAQTPAPSGGDALAPLDFLLGTWSATTTGGAAGAQTSGTYTFARDLNGHELTRTTSADSCKGPAGFDCLHHDQLIVFSDPNGRSVHGSSLFAFYADSEGHIIYYTVSTPDANTAVFDSQNAPGSPKFRLTYHRANKTMTGSFAMAAPGTTEYHAYLEWSGTRR